MPASIAASTALLLPASSHAHAFGQRYDLPLPLALYLGAAAAAVVLSFAVAALFTRETATGAPGGIELGGTLFGRCLQSDAAAGAVKAASLVLYVTTLAAGLLGAQSPTQNFAATFVWVIWWVGMTYAAALLGNVWDIVNPWRILYDLASRLFPALRSPLRTYPERLGVWPAFGLFILFCYLELIAVEGEVPRTLAVLVLLYSALMFAGMRLYGRETWLGRGDAFTIFFRVVSRFGMFWGDIDSRSLRLRPPGTGLHGGQPLSVSVTAFVLLMLTTVSFDGVLETPLWASIVDHVSQSRPLRPLLLFLQGNGVNLLYFVKSVALVVMYLAVASVYLFFSLLIARLSNGESVSRTARLYVLSLVPIALAYHLAHYFSYLLLAGQLIIPLSSDPLGFGWDLWGTAGRTIDITVVTASDVWYVSVAAIVAGHVVAVYLAHRVALEHLQDRRRAVLSQLPMLVLMAGYTMLSLWILSQPIVTSG